MVKEGKQGETKQGRRRYKKLERKKERGMKEVW